MKKGIDQLQVASKRMLPRPILPLASLAGSPNQDPALRIIRPWTSPFDQLPLNATKSDLKKNVFFKIVRPTARLPLPRGTLPEAGSSLLDVGCWMLDVRCSLSPSARSHIRQNTSCPPAA